MVLGTITAGINRLPRHGERCVVAGRALDVQGRKASTATTLWSGDEVLARATAVWVAVDPKAFSALRGSSA
jgi:acyl-CoA thioesterase FadM